MGTIFLTVIGGIVAWLVRSYLNSQERTAVRHRLEATSAADPLELDDVRVANSGLVQLNIKAFQQVMELVQSQLETTSEDACYRMTYPQFVSAVRTALLTIHAKEPPSFTDTSASEVAVTVQLGHILDRIALSMLWKQEPPPQQHALETNRLLNTVSLPLAQWWTLLSLAMDVMPRQRIPILLQAIVIQSSSMGGTETDEFSLEATPTANRTNDDVTVSYEQVVELVSYLQASCQLAPDAQIVADPSRQYPLQRYTIGTPHQLVDLALTTMATTTTTSSSNAATTASTTAQHPELQHEARLFDCQALEAILTSKSVCAWGECYRKTKP
jgi:hypothetical protein